MADIDQDRAAGALLGLAWGDALGAPIEGWSAEDIQRHFGTYDDLPQRYPESVDQLPLRRRRRLRPLGLHTDDTQQALALLAVCMDGWSPQLWADWLVEGVVTHAWRGSGPNFRAAVRDLHRGVSPFASGSQSAGIGAAMRSGVLGAWFRDDPLALQQVAFESATVTHADMRAGAVAFAVAHAVQQLVAGRGIDDVVDDLVADVSVAESSWQARAAGQWSIAGTGQRAASDVLDAVLHDEPRDASELSASVLRRGGGQLPHHVVPKANQGFALLGGVHALLTALLLDSDPREVLAGLVRQGADTDTVAAICGSILGARHGTSWIPAERLVDADRMRTWSHALATHGPAPETRAAFMQRERELTQLT